MALHWCIHGIHHTFPQERLRLVFPIVPGIVVLNSFLTLPGYVVGGFIYGPLIVAGAFTGYVAYDMLHFMCHHSSPRGYLKELKMTHMAHHYRNG